MDCNCTELETPDLIRLILTLVLELARRFGIHTFPGYAQRTAELSSLRLAFTSVVILSVRSRVVTGSVPGLIQDTVIIGAASITDCKVGWEPRDIFFGTTDESEVFQNQHVEDECENVDQSHAKSPAFEDSDLEAMGGSLPSDLGQLTR